jgi:NADH dehydrogenase FAD-containing subunit
MITGQLWSLSTIFVPSVRRRRPRFPPLRSILIKQKNTQVLLGDVRHVDAAAKRVMLADGGVFPYGHLIGAAGSQTSY